MKLLNKNAPCLPYLFILVTLYLSGCSSVVKEGITVTKETPQQRVAKLSQLQHWKIKGKIAFIEKDARNSATLLWQVNESQQSQQLNLTSYLGINVLQLTSEKSVHTLKTDGEVYQGNNLQDLIRSITGLTLPTQALTSWIKGVPYQATDSISFQETTQLPQTLTSKYNDEFWQVTYANYQHINGFNLATRFSIKKGDLVIKISVNEWSI